MNITFHSISKHQNGIKIAVSGEDNVINSIVISLEAFKHLIPTDNIEPIMACGSTGWTPGPKPATVIDKAAPGEDDVNN